MRALPATATLVAAATGLAAACTGSISQQGTTTYVAEAGAEIRTVALMPVRTLDDAEGFQRGIERILRDSLTSRYGEDAVVPASQTRQDLSEAGLADAYAEMMANYDDTGVLDAEQMREIADAVDAPQLLYVTARYWESTRGLQEDYRQRMTMRGKLLSREAGDVVWEGQGEVDRPVNDEIESGDPIEVIAGAATNSLINSMP